MYYFSPYHDFFQTRKERMKKCYVHLERLPEHIIKNSFVKVHVNFESSSQETLMLDEIKTEEHTDLDDNIYNDKVSHSFIFFC